MIDKTEVHLQLLAQWEIKHFQSDIFSSEQWNLSDIKHYLLNTSNSASPLAYSVPLTHFTTDLQPLFTVKNKKPLEHHLT